jgi:hypothetical protein
MTEQSYVLSDEVINEVIRLADQVAAYRTAIHRRNFEVDGGALVLVQSALARAEDDYRNATLGFTVYDFERVGQRRKERTPERAPNTVTFTPVEPAGP